MKLVVFYIPSPKAWGYKTHSAFYKYHIKRKFISDAILIKHWGVKTVIYKCVQVLNSTLSICNASYMSIIFQSMTYCVYYVLIITIELNHQCHIDFLWCPSWLVSPSLHVRQCLALYAFAEGWLLLNVR